MKMNMSREAGSGFAGKKIFLLSVVFMVALSPLVAVAAGNPCTPSAITAGGDTASTLPMCINQVYVWSLGAGALLALLMTVIGGYYYMTASGNAEQSGKGVEMIWGSVIGLALLFGAYLLLRTINPALVDLKFNSAFCLDPANKEKAECVDYYKKSGSTPPDTTTPNAPTGIPPQSQQPPGNDCVPSPRAQC